jgi:hypothetical protein
MAGTTGIYGSRKGLSDVLFRLTGKAVIPIANHFSQYGTKTDEGILLAGLLLCNMWKNNNESLLPPELYDMSFVGLIDNPTECVKWYLTNNKINDEKMEGIVENSLRLGYITYDPVPYEGLLSVSDMHGDKLSWIDLHSWIPTNPVQREQLPGRYTDKEANYGNLLRLISFPFREDSFQTDKFDWDTLVMRAVDDYQSVIDRPDDLGLEIDYKSTVYNDLHNIIGTKAAIYDDLDNIIKDMILKGTIIADCKAVAKVVLTWD